MAWHASLYDGKLGATAQDDRQLIEAAIGGVGVIDIGDLLVSAGSGLNSSIAAGRATIRNTFATTQGGLYLVRNDAAVSYAHNSADPTNPRIDQVLAKVYDSETGGDSSDVPSGVIVPGTAIGGATLDNRTGAGSLAAFNNYILISDVLVPAAAVSAAGYTYRDRRPLAMPVSPASVKTTLNACMLSPVDSLPTGGNSQAWPLGSNNSQIAYAAYLPRRITATKIRWAYLGSATQTCNYNVGIFDASGRQVVSIGSTALVASASLQARAETIATTTFEAGLYYVCWGIASAAGAGTITYPGMIANTNNSVCLLPNVWLWSTTGGITMPTTLSAFTDANATIPGVSGNAPLIALSQT